MEAKADSGRRQVIAFQDEGRFGLKPYTGRLWSQRGQRTLLPQRPGYKNFYVSAVVEPVEGRVYHEQAERMNADWFQGFLDRLSAAWADVDTLVVLDRAGWHQAKRLAWPANVRPVSLPAYSPELNPVERIWLRSKADILRNKVFDCIDAQKAAVLGWFQGFRPDAAKSLCACSYLVSQIS